MFQRNTGVRIALIRLAIATLLIWLTCETTWAQLHTAIRKNDAKQVRNLVTKNLKLLERKDYRKLTPLIFAIEQSNTEMARLLIELGANIDAVDGNQRTPLHSAIVHRRIEIADILFKQNPNANTRNSQGETPLSYAIGNGLPDKTLDKLIAITDLKGTVNTPHLGPTSYLYHACYRQNWMAAEKLMAATEDLKTMDFGKPMGPAFWFDNETLVLKMIHQGYTIPTEFSYRPETILHYAIRKKNVEIAKLLVKKGFDINAIDPNSATPYLQAAIYSKESGIVDLLIEKGADTNQRDSLGRDLLAIAITHGCNAEIVRTLIDHMSDFDPNAVCEYYHWTYLASACSYSNLETVQTLLEAGAGINFQEPQYGRTALMSAAARGDVEIYDCLIKRGANPKLKGNDGSTVFHSVCSSGNLDFIRREIAQVEDINARTDSGETAFYNAAFAANAQPILELLRQHGASAEGVVERGKGTYPTPLHFYTNMLQPKMVEFLINNGANVNACAKDGVRPLHYLVKRHANSAGTDPQVMSEIGDLLLTHGAEKSAPNAAGETALELAVRHHNLFLVSRLLPNSQLETFKIGDQYLIHWACETGQLETLELILARGIKLDSIVDGNGNTPLLVSVQNEQLECAEWLLESTQNLDAVNLNGESAIQIATLKGNLQLVELLVNAGCDVNQVDSGKESLLHYAAWMKQSAIAEVLVKHGADVNAAAQTGKTPLHLAAWQGNLEICKMLLDAKANVNAVDQELSTPLFKASMQGHYNVVRLLLANKADLTLVAESGLDALQIAESQGHTRIAKLLRVFQEED